MKLIRFQMNQRTMLEYAGGVDDSANGRVVCIQFIPEIQHLSAVSNVGPGYVDGGASLFE